jgi:hypothetical protein
MIHLEVRKKSTVQRNDDVAETIQEKETSDIDRDVTNTNYLIASPTAADPLVPFLISVVLRGITDLFQAQQAASHETFNLRAKVPGWEIIGGVFSNKFRLCGVNP